MLNYQIVDFMAGQLADQYATQKAAGFSYPNEEELPKFFRAQAAKLAANGVTSIYDVGTQERETEKVIAYNDDGSPVYGPSTDQFLINKQTGQDIRDVVLKPSWEEDPEAYSFRKPVTLETTPAGFTRWGKDLSVKGQGDYGLNFVDGVPVYTPFWKDTATDPGAIIIAGALLGAGLYQLAGAGAAAGAGTAGAGTGSAAGTGLTIGSGGTTGLTIGTTSTGIGGGAIGTGLTAPAGFTLAPGVGASLAAGGAGIGLLDGAYTSSMGETGLLPGAAGEGLTVPTTPGLSSMGGAQGLTIPVTGGVVTELGFVPIGSTPVLGDPGSFINDPNVLGRPTFTTDTLNLPGGTDLDLIDTLQDISKVTDLLGTEQQQTQQQQQRRVAGGQPRGVDYSGLLPANIVRLLPLAERYRRSLI